MTALVLVAPVACGRGDSVSCGEVERIRDPRAGTHVVSLEFDDYDHHPPAAGPHFAGTPPDLGVHDEPVAEARQVEALEDGIVVLQYDEEAADDAARLEALAEGRDDVIVAPAATPIDDGRHVAFTAKELRQRCDGINDTAIDAAERFIADHANRAPH